MWIFKHFRYLKLLIYYIFVTNMAKFYYFCKQKKCLDFYSITFQYKRELKF